MAKPKKEVLSVRLDPKLKYQLEIATRLSNSSMTEFVSDAISKAIQMAPLEVDDVTIETEDGEVMFFPQSTTRLFMEVSEKIWHSKEYGRLLKLSSYAPKALSYEEQKVINVLSSNKQLFIKDKSKDATFDNIDFDAIEKKWEDIKSVARGEKDTSALSDS